MSETVIYSVHEGVAVLALSNPPSNTLNAVVRTALLAALERSEADPEVREIVLTGKGASFAAGVDLTDYDVGLQPPSLGDLCNRIEASAKPVVAAVQGPALGGGFELVLAAHYRVARSDARIGMPEIRLGLSPSGGATQRMPRLSGAQIALDLLLSGRLAQVDRPPARIFFDQVTDADADVVHEALRFCQTLRRTGTGRRRTRDIRSGFNDPAAYQEAIAARRAQLGAGARDAPVEILAAVEAALVLPFDVGLAREADAFEQLLGSDPSKALRHAFLAERRAARFPVTQEMSLPDVSVVTVLGGGPLAMQIVAAVLQAGLKVQWGTRDPEPLEQGVAQVRALFETGVARGNVTREKADKLLAQLVFGDSAAMTAGTDLILHAARGQGDVPAPPETVRAVAFPGRVDKLGLRFALPVFSARLVEVVQGPEATPRHMAMALALAHRMNKVPVRVVSEGDSIAARMMVAVQRAADALVDMGQSPYAVDAALRSWGWARPPFEMRDAIGLGEFAGHARGAGARNWSAALTAAGRTGRASGAGFYRYAQAIGRPEADAEVSQIIDTERKIAPPMSGEHIVTLMVGALANEGARMLAEGWVTRPSDIDVVMMLSQEFPRFRGGPMKAADLLGLFAVRLALERFAHPDTAFWTPVPVFAELIKNGRTFDWFN